MFVFEGQPSRVKKSERDPIFIAKFLCHTHPPKENNRSKTNPPKKWLYKSSFQNKPTASQEHPNTHLHKVCRNTTIYILTMKNPGHNTPPTQTYILKVPIEKNTSPPIWDIDSDPHDVGQLSRSHLRWEQGRAGNGDLATIRQCHLALSEGRQVFYPQRIICPVDGKNLRKPVDTCALYVNSASKVIFTRSTGGIFLASTVSRHKTMDVLVPGISLSKAPDKTGVG